MKITFIKKIKNLYYKYKFKLWDFFYYKSPVYIEFNIFRLYKDWFKVRKVFHKPILKRYKMNVDENTLGSDYFYLETSCYNKWLYFAVHSCDYKLKYGEIRFESVPHICLIWKNKIKYVWGLEAPLYEEIYKTDYNYISKNNLLYWEGILTYLWEYNKDIVKTYHNNIWTKSLTLNEIDKETNKHKTYIIYYTLLHCLKPKYADIIINKINNNKKDE